MWYFQVLICCHPDIMCELPGWLYSWHPRTVSYVLLPGLLLRMSCHMASGVYTTYVLLPGLLLRMNCHLASGVYTTCVMLPGLVLRMNCHVASGVYTTCGDVAMQGYCWGWTATWHLECPTTFPRNVFFTNSQMPFLVVKKTRTAFPTQLTIMMPKKSIKHF